jgi:hypothetical protein
LVVGDTTGTATKTGAMVRLPSEDGVGKATVTGDGGGVEIGDGSTGPCDGTTGWKIVELGDWVGKPVEKKTGGVTRIGVGVVGRSVDGTVTGWDTVGIGAIVVGLADETGAAIGAGVGIVQPGAEQSPNITKATATSEPLALVQVYDESRSL